MPHTAALIALTPLQARSGGTASLRACVIGLRMPDEEGEPVLEVVGHGHPARASLERFIAGCFFRSYGAVIRHFADTLLGVRGADGQWQAALGYSLPVARPQVFVEQYLDLPLEQALSGVLRKGQQDPAFVRKLVEDGQAFDDLEHVSASLHCFSCRECL